METSHSFLVAQDGSGGSVSVTDIDGYATKCYKQLIVVTFKIVFNSVMCMCLCRSYSLSSLIDVTNYVHILLSLCMICANLTCSVLVKPVFMCAAI